MKSARVETTAGGATTIVCGMHRWVLTREIKIVWGSPDESAAHRVPGRHRWPLKPVVRGAPSYLRLGRL